MTAEVQKDDVAAVGLNPMPSIPAMVRELRELALTHPMIARGAGWQYLKELGDRDDRKALVELFAEGTAPQGPEGKMEGMIVGKLFGIPEAHLANPLMRIDPTWRGKTFDQKAGTGFNRLSMIARLVMPVVAFGYRGLRRVGREMEGFDFRHSIERGAIEPRMMVRALDYGVPEYKNPSVRTFPIKRTRDEIVEVVPGLYLGRALLTMPDGDVRLIAHFALREPIGSPL